MRPTDPVPCLVARQFSQPAASLAVLVNRLQTLRPVKLFFPISGRVSLVALRELVSQDSQEVWRVVRCRLLDAPRLATLKGHGGSGVGAIDRTLLEHLCRYETRPAPSDERVHFNHAGQVFR